MDQTYYKTGQRCPRDGTYQCRLSKELQRYKRGDTFDFCPLGKATEWKRSE